MQSEIKNLKKAKERILQAGKNKERVLIYADSDPDGVTSAVILRDTLMNLSLDVERVYFMDRENEGYGVSEKALKELATFAPALLIILDCGTTSPKEIEKAKELGFFTLVIDHHRIIKEKPKADIFINPHQPGDNYPFKDLATCGLVLKLSELLLGEKFKGPLRESLYELAALGTIADMMPREEDNLEIITEGVRSLENTFRPGLRALIELPQIQEDRNQGEKALAQKIASILGAGEVNENKIHQAYELLTTTDFEEAEKLAKAIFEKFEEKKNMVQRIVEEVSWRNAEKKDLKFIFEGSSNWKLSQLGSAATKLVQKFKKPVFLFKIYSEESRGSVRSIEGIDSLTAMEYCKKYLESFGGHPLASGFSIKNQNLEKFKACLQEFFNQALKEENKAKLEKRNEKDNH